jgi:S-formylglutathione hydrolase FrmB
LSYLGVIVILDMAFKTAATIASFGGKLLKLTHTASSTGCEMALNLYLPPQAAHKGQKVPVLFYLSGLTCTGDNCAEKGFFQYGASQKGIAIVYPDTSPRNIPSSPKVLPMLTVICHRRTKN